MRLLRPAQALLPGYLAALDRGFLPSNIDGERIAAQHRAAIARDADAFLASLHNPAGSGPPIRLPDGSQAPRLPGMQHWLWDREFLGFMALRWQAGTAALPAHVLGHIGYAVVPWRRGEGIATRGLALLLEHAREQGLPHVELTTDTDNTASHGVITRNGGVLVERFAKPVAYGGAQALRWRIALPSRA